MQYPNTKCNINFNIKTLWYHSYLARQIVRWFKVMNIETEREVSNVLSNCSKSNMHAFICKYYFALSVCLQ